MNLYQYADQLLSSNHFLKAMKEIIQPNSVIYVEFDVMTFGKLADPSLTKSQFLGGVWSIFKELAGPEGLVISPAFSYSWGSNQPEKVFDLKNTKSKVGAMGEFLRQNPELVRTADPMFSFMVYGKNKEAFAECSNHSFGKGSIFEKLLEKNAYLVSFGLNRYDPTFVHYVEQYFSENIAPYPYRSLVDFHGEFINASGEKKQSTQYCLMRPLGSNFSFSDQKLHQVLQESHLLKTIKMGGGIIQISDCKSVFKVGCEGLKQDSKFFVAEN